MTEDNTQLDWQALSAEDKKRALFEKQKKMLDTFLSTGAITQAQYRKSLTCLAEKMGYAGACGDDGD